MPTTEIERAAALIAEAEALVISAGAGMGVDSGLPDYRGTGGFWKTFPPYRYMGVDFTQLTRPRGFITDPALSWGFYGHRLELYRNAEPHRGFLILKDIGHRKPGGYFVFTSNVDGQFQKAGFNPDLVHECHGSIHRLQCVHPCSRDIWDMGTQTVVVDNATMRASEPLPRCKHCGSLARPNIFGFADTTFIWELSLEQADRFRKWQETNGQRRIVIVECGAGIDCPGIRRHGEELCAQLPSATLVRINPRDAQTPSTQHVSLYMPALEAIEKIRSMIAR
jgi:NAD-dependent SIR2 family protein deacetylase